MKTVQTTRYACARCGHPDRPDRMVFSTYTRLRYCQDFAACDRRARRRAKNATAETTA